MTDSFGTREVLDVGGKSYEIFALDAVGGLSGPSRLPYSLKILLENLLRHEDGISVTAGPGPDARLHRGSGDRRSRRHA